MKRRLISIALSLIIAISCVPLTAFCDSADQSEVLVLMYIVGSDIESMFREFTRGNSDRLSDGVFHQLFAADLPDSIEFIIQTGGCEDWGEVECPDGSKVQISNEYAQRYRLLDDGLELINDNLGDQHIASTPSAVSDFLSWGVLNHPAKRTIMIMCDHGTGSMLGYGDMKSIEVTGGLLDGVNRVRETIPDFKLDLFNFDACLQGSLEYALTLSPIADYFIGSQQTENGGQFHDVWFSALCENPEMPIREIAQTMVDGHASLMETRRSAVNQTLSYVQLDKIGAVEEAYEGLLKIMDEDYLSISDDPNYFFNLSVAMNSAYSFSPEIGMVDLVSFARILGGLIPEIDENYGEVSRYVAALEEAMNEAVYTRVGSGVNDANGLSIYVPLGIITPLFLGADGVKQVLDRAYGSDSPVTSFILKTIAVQGSGNASLAPVKEYFEKNDPETAALADEVRALFAHDDEDNVSCSRKDGWYNIKLTDGLALNTATAELQLYMKAADGSVYMIGKTDIGSYVDQNTIELYFPDDKRLTLDGQWIPFTCVERDDDENELTVKVKGELADADKPYDPEDAVSANLYLRLKADGDVIMQGVEPISDISSTMRSESIGQNREFIVSYSAIMQAEGTKAPVVKLNDESHLVYADAQSDQTSLSILSLTDVFAAPSIIQLNDKIVEK